MGAAASLRASSEPTAAEAEVPLMTDFALHEVLRNFQLSPDTIDKSTAAIYAHVRDPVQHTVEKDLARLCASDYTRGALHALSWYLLAMSNLQRSQETELEGSLSRAGPMTLLSPTLPAPRESAIAGIPHRRAAAAKGDNGNSSSGGGGQTKRRQADVGEWGGDTLTKSMTNRLTTMINRLRRTRSMPSREQAGVASDDDSHRSNGDFDDYNMDSGPSSPPFPLSDSAPSPDGINRPAAHGHGGDGVPRLNMLVNSRGPPSPLSSLSPRSQRRTYLVGGLQLGSPNPRGRATSPRRAPIKTGRWKLGHEIGKGSFGKVHIGLNEESGDLIAVKMLPLADADAAETLYKEIELMRQLSHRNIVSYLGAEVRPKQTAVYIYE